MRKLIASTFVSLDGVMQAPGAPAEDPTGNFAFGGWMAAFGDPEMDISEAGFDGVNRDLLLGRKTYEIFEAYWPYQNNPIANSLNAAKKHVASRSLKALEWNNSSLLGDDIVSAITALKNQSGYDLQIIGSGNLIHSLQASSLIDVFHVWTFPVILGRGKRLFENSSLPSTMRLISSKVSTSGVVMSAYAPTGKVEVGTIGPVVVPSDKEVKRRARMADNSW